MAHALKQRGYLQYFYHYDWPHFQKLVFYASYDHWGHKSRHNPVHLSNIIQKYRVNSQCSQQSHDKVQIDLLLQSHHPLQKPPSELIFRN